MRSSSPANSAGPSAHMLMSMPSPELASVAVAAGYDSVILDLEHGFPIGRDIQHMILACHEAGGQCFARLAPSQSSYAPALADQGLDGLLLSNATAVEQISSLSRGIRFPPEGRRSLNPFVAAAGLPGDESALMESQPKVWAMAETPELLSDLAANRQPEAPDIGCSALIVGPYDLSARIRENTTGPENVDLQSAVLRFAEQADRHDIEFGLFCRNFDSLKAWLSIGVTPSLIIAGYDRDLWHERCLSMIQQLTVERRQLQ